MRILGCFKAVPALDLLREEDWVADDSLRVDTEYVKLEWNCFDEGALEMMRKLSDKAHRICQENRLPAGERAASCRRIQRREQLVLRQDPGACQAV